MSFANFKEVIEEGDTVIIYVNIHSMYALEVTPEKENRNGEITPHIFQTSYGALKVKDLIGQRFGTKIRMSRGYAYALYPTPDLWTRTLPHRTQILYATDISLIILQLELKPGSIVVESGTGSGSLAHSLVRTIAPTGHLHTFGKLLNVLITSNIMIKVIAKLIKIVLSHFYYFSIKFYLFVEII